MFITCENNNLENPSENSNFKVKLLTSTFLIHTWAGDSSLEQPNLLTFTSARQSDWKFKEKKNFYRKSCFLNTFVWIFIGGRLSGFLRGRLKEDYLGWFSLLKQRNDSYSCQFGNFIQSLSTRAWESIQNGLIQ